MKYSLGLDIGTTSIGWCILNQDNKRIENLGVRIFQAAENPKNGASLALPRRLARSARRRIRRRAFRLTQIKQLFEKYIIISTQEIENIFNFSHSENPYTLRAEGLERILIKEEWVRVLYHIAKHRGFKSNRKKSSDNDKDLGKMLNGIKHTEDILKEKNYRTIGEMLAKDPEFSDNKRNKAGNYQNTVARDLLFKETEILFDAQQRFGNSYTSEEFKNKFLEIFYYQRPFANADDILEKVGPCTFESTEKRAPRNSWSAERFSLLSKINNLKLLTVSDKIPLTQEQRNIIATLAYKNSKVTYKQVRTALNLDNSFLFPGLSYKDKDKAEDKTFIELKGFHELRKKVTGYLGNIEWINLSSNKNTLNDIAFAVTFYKTDQDIINYLKDKGLKEEIINSILEVSFTKVIHLSFKALDKIIPFLEQGLLYNEACEKAGYSHFMPGGNNEKNHLLPLIPAEEIRNPVVIRSLTQTRKVVNEIIRKYGSPFTINIEIARELSKPFEERISIKKEQEDYQKEKEAIVNNFYDTFKVYPSGDALLKYRLWKNQNGYCPYSQQYIDPNRMFEPGYAEVDHIIPYSRSFDDSMSNKILVKGEKNRGKGDQIPCEYFGGEDSVKWHEYKEWVLSNINNFTKRQKLLRISFTPRDEDDLKARHLNDTRYICRYISQFIQEYLEFAPGEQKQRVKVLSGQITAFLRHQWGLVKIREEGHKHHALDAAVIAATTSGMIKNIEIYSKNCELYNFKHGDDYVNPVTGEISDSVYQDDIPARKFPEIWKHFREELKARLSESPKEELEKISLDSYKDMNLESFKPLFVSWAPNRKIDGEAHKETIRSIKNIENGFKSVKTQLKDVTPEILENILNKDRDVLLYNALKKQLQQFKDDPKKAFAEPFYKPSKNGSMGPVVRSIKVKTNGTSGIPVRYGIADNGGMVRVDIFSKNKKYFIVPVYITDMLSKKLPDRAIVAHKDEKDWVLIDENYSFCFSLYPNDLVYVEISNKKILGYYIMAHRGTGAIYLVLHDKSNKDSISIGVKSAVKFEKMVVDVLGNIYTVKKETRNGLEKFINNKTIQDEDGA